MMSGGVVPSVQARRPVSVRLVVVAVGDAFVVGAAGEEQFVGVGRAVGCPVRAVVDLAVVAGLEAVRAGAAAVAGKTVLVLHRSTRAVQTTTPSAILGRYRLTNRQADTPEFQLWTLRPLLPIVTA